MAAVVLGIEVNAARSSAKSTSSKEEEEEGISSSYPLPVYFMRSSSHSAICTFLPSFLHPFDLIRFDSISHFCAYSFDLSIQSALPACLPN